MVLVIEQRRVALRQTKLQARRLGKLVPRRETWPIVGAGRWYAGGMRSVLLALLLFGCGGGPDPILRNVPQPNPSAVAGAAAAVAGAATLAAPNAQANRVDEANKPDPSDKPMKPGPRVPADVLDRLDEAPPPEAEPPPSERPIDPKSKKGPAVKAPKSKPQPLTPPSSNPLSPGAPIQ